MTHQGTLRICCPNALGASEDVKVDSPLTVLSVFLPYANIREFWLFSSLYSSVVNSEICMCGLSKGHTLNGLKTNVRDLTTTKKK